MIIHATRKLSERLPTMSKEPLDEDSPLGSWHADRLTLDRRQCVLFCHDASRAAQFDAYLFNRFPNVLTMDPVGTSHRLTRRPVSVRGKHFWPQDKLLDMIDALE